MKYNNVFNARARAEWRAGPLPITHCQRSITLISRQSRGRGVNRDGSPRGATSAATGRTRCFLTQLTIPLVLVLKYPHIGGENKINLLVPSKNDTGLC
jgi:hypothetical protein